MSGGEARRQSESGKTAQDNRDQIIRQDARGCFVEVKNDCFHIDKIHLQFVAYDKSKPQGQRYTGNIHIYIDVPEFLVLAKEAETGALHARMQQYKQAKKSDPLYECLGGTSAAQLAHYGRPRPDGKSLSRVAKLVGADRADYLFVADSGPGEQDEKGLIVPRFGKNPEQHVAVSLSWRQVNELLLTTTTHYQAWLSAKYAAEWSLMNAPRTGDREPGATSGSSPAKPHPTPKQPAPASQPKPAAQSGFDSAFGSVYGRETGRAPADDMRMF
ncbi:hypothetical protein SDC9_78731 [bioreactor metagenome]|uniref:Uncharacterized protein n=1 Tax=bioreactor metagenome TaxID=1076179 RepID=A0A644YUD1_9ZZZZ